MSSPPQSNVLYLLSPKIAFLLVSFTLGELGDGLNIFQGIYLVGLGWNEGSVGTALSLMGLTALLVQPWAGDWVDKTTVDRRVFLTVASVVTALSASAIFLVRQDTNSAQQQHAFIFITKIIEGVSSSFIGPCLAALTLATFGPHHFDAVMASNLLWGHVGSVVAAMLAGIVAYFSYPQIQYCFFVIGVSAMCAVFLIRFLPQGDARMGRGFHGTVAVDEQGHIELLQNNEKVSAHPEVAASYRDVFLDSRSAILCLTGFFFHFANANVLLVLGELMSQDNTSDNDDSTPRRSAIPLIAGAIVTAQVTMAATTHVVDKLTMAGIGRKPLFMAGIATLPIRCALIVLFKDMGDVFLLSTQILDGIGGGIFGLLHPYLVADITFGTGRFNVLMGLTASCFGLGATMSNFFGQLVVEKFGHIASLICSLLISFIPLVLFGLMPETMGQRGQGTISTPRRLVDDEPGSYIQMNDSVRV